MCVCCAGVCVCSVCYMHSTSFTIFGQRAASSSLAPAMSVHISHSTPTPSAATPPWPTLLSSHMLNGNFAFNFECYLWEGKGKGKKKEKRNATQKKNKQKLLSKFKQRFVLLPLYVASLGLHRPIDPPIPSLSFFPFFFACAAYVPWDKQIRRWIVCVAWQLRQSKMGFR